MNKFSWVPCNLCGAEIDEKDVFRIDGQDFCLQCHNDYSNEGEVELPEQSFVEVSNG